MARGRKNPIASGDRRAKLGGVCRHCKGTGKVNRREVVPGSFFGGKATHVETCPKCQGRGRR